MSIKVATRVRPFNDHEIQKNQPLCIAMNGNKTILFDSDKEKVFHFDYSFWSHDKFEVDEKGYRKPLPNSGYADQNMIFNTVRKDTINQLFQGQNCCILTFGQQKSGRSYTLSGSDDNQGLIHNFVQGIFQQLSQSQTINTKYEVYTSMLFISNENVYDQLSPTNFQQLKVRENALQGVYVENLIEEQFDSPESFEQIRKKGLNSILKYQTMMSILLTHIHTIFQIQIKETKMLDDQLIENFRRINFGDLACLDKSIKINNSSGYQSISVNIGKSLSTLGEVICKILMQSQQQDQKIYPPYRNSKLTRILQQTLNLKSNIILILTISPAINAFEQTLGNLRFAYQFMKIKNNDGCKQKIAENNQFLNQNEAETQIQTQTKIVQSNIKQQIENKQDCEIYQNTQFIEKFNKSEEMYSNNDIQYKAVISQRDGIIELKPFSQESCENIFVNNQQIKELTKLSHNDRITFGKSTTLLVQYFGQEKIQSDSNIIFVEKDTTKTSENNPIIEDVNKSIDFEQQLNQ
ncbi:unnamed protein product [Paramecium pentaurelia]|uniref:Kinesin motor domain-containing protein n=1 Tax=Paramecium pentaurelia TaxID=43138 RepID=A0A8S1SEK3_9CILI|nr:unnamed protein product [Paramecium pentaurelia]